MGTTYHLRPCASARDALKRHTKKPPCNSTFGGRGGQKYSQRSCLVSLRGVASPPLSPRLWPAAPLTVTVQRAGKEKERDNV